jgi:hypothetical protein
MWGVAERGQAKNRRQDEPKPNLARSLMWRAFRRGGPLNGDVRVSMTGSNAAVSNSLI